MDEEEISKFTVELGAKINPSANNAMNQFLRKVHQIPENRELRLRINKRNTLSNELNKELKAWNKFEKSVDMLRRAYGERRPAITTDVIVGFPGSHELVVTDDVFIEER